MRLKRTTALLLIFGLLAGLTSSARAADPTDPDQRYDLTPPRLSLAEGQVSFWRPGADDWATAQVNTPLAPGDEVATASPGNLEIQIGAYGFVRGWTNTQIGLENQEPGFIQFKVTDGSAAFDLRRLEPGGTVEVDTPNAAFTIAQPGYYRVDVTGDRTAFITRRAGRATVTPAGGAPVVITPSEEIDIDGASAPRVASFVAPPLDSWDQWNYTRTDKLLEAVSARYVGPDIYGESDLDLYGSWRVVPDYGAVWFPRDLRAGWTPYSTGAWVKDPVYGWTWVDTAPWGWAPYHYGRWVFVDGLWAWAPGPVVARPVYAPALVAFFGGPEVGVAVGGPLVGWVALGWGEPVVPWWGRAGFIHEPSWRGWGGPRVVNNVVVSNTTVVNVQNINVYRNASMKDALVVVNQDRFGRGPITSAREARFDERSLRLTHEAPQIAARPASFTPTLGRGVRPPAASLSRPVVATRPPRPVAEPAAGAERRGGPPAAAAPAPAPRLVSAPPASTSAAVPPRPPFGQSTVERPAAVRTQAPPPPRAMATRNLPEARPQAVGGTSEAAPRAGVPPAKARRADMPTGSAAPAVAPPARSTPPPPARRVESPPAGAPASSPPQQSRVAPPQSVRPDGGQPPRRLPGEPANRLSPNREAPPQQHGEH